MTLPEQMRKRALVLLIAHLSGKVSGKTKFQKFAFLVQQESRSPHFSSVFHFIPYYYGPYSADLTNVVSQLVREQLIAPDEYVVVKNGEERMGSSFFVTQQGAMEAERLLSQVPHEEAERIRAVLGRYRTLPLPKLLEYVYSQYPEMTLQGRTA